MHITTSIHRINFSIIHKFLISYLLLRLFEYFTGNITMWKHFLKDYFIFTHKERAGIISIVSVLVFLILISYFFPFLIKQKLYSHRDFENEIARLTIEAKDSSKNRNYSKNFDNGLYDDFPPAGKIKYETVKAAVFYFDPNTASSDDWSRLGVRAKTITTIKKYLSKGGRFNKPEDITKIWGLSPKDQQRLMPYVSIKAIVHEPVVFEKDKYLKPASYSIKKNLPIDVNLADTTAFISLPGIGSKLSQRIIAFRDKLGGFYSIDQVGETFLLPDSTFQKIKPYLLLNNSTVKKINLNLATLEELKAHPYLRYNIANVIIQYRNQHGEFKSIEDVKKIVLITDEIFNKVAPYLTVN